MTNSRYHPSYLRRVKPRGRL